MSAAEVPVGTSPFGPAAAAAAKAKAAGVPGPIPFMFGTGAAPPTAAPAAEPAPAPAAGPAPPRHTPEPSPRQMMEVIEQMAARMGEKCSRLEAQMQTIGAQQNMINQMQIELSATRVATTRTDAFNERMVEALEVLGESCKTKSAVDSKGIGKPFTFSSDEARFAAWQRRSSATMLRQLCRVPEFSWTWPGIRGPSR